jgi:hypothetical protein
VANKITGANADALDRLRRSVLSFEGRAKMKSAVPIMVISVLFACHAGATTNAVPLVQVDSRDFGDTNCFMRVVELERNANTSKLRLTYQKLGSSVGSSMFIMRGFYEVAKARGAEYFINLKEWDDQNGGRIYIAGFTNVKEADLKKEFGDEFSYENESGQKRGFMGVTQLKIIFERQKEDIEPSAPTNGASSRH